MEALGLIFTIVILVVGSLLAWTYTKSGKEWLKTCNIMEGLIFSLVIVIVGSILAWTYTKKGEEWLKNL